MAIKSATTRERVGRAGQRRQVVIPREMHDPDDTLTPPEAEVVRRGEAQFKRGRSKPWRDVKHALAR
jgi:hypothetical protein